jgi:tetratricopeptide (TPR) repeat protein
LCRELLARGSADRLKLACGDPRYASYTLAELLLERCRYQVSADPEDALELGELAVAVSERLSPERFGACASLDLKARCWAVLADARRAGGDTRSAERAVAVAESLFTQGTREPLEKAEILLVKARLRRDQGRHRDAQEILDRTISLYRRHGGARDLGMALLRKGRVLAGLGEWEKAADLLRRGLVKLGKRVEPQVRLPALHDLITCLAELGRAQEAQRWLRRSRALTKELGDPLSELRHRWQAGRVAWVMRRFEEAEAALVECRQGFLEHGQGADAGLLTLELAGLYSERQEPEKVHALGSPEPHEGSLGEARFALEVSTALYLFHRAARTRRASAGLIRQLAHYVSRRRGCEAWVP